MVRGAPSKKSMPKAAPARSASPTLRPTATWIWCSTTKIVPAVNQVETHPFLQRAEEQQFLAKHGTILESWGPFAEGRNQLFTNAVLTKIGDQYGKTTAQVVLRWFIQRGIIVIPKSVRPERMAENLDIFDFELSETDMAAIATLGGDASLFIDHTSPEAVEMLVHALTIE